MQENVSLQIFGNDTVRQNGRNNCNLNNKEPRNNNNGFLASNTNIKLLIFTNKEAKAGYIAFFADVLCACHVFLPHALGRKDCDCDESKDHLCRIGGLR